MKRALLTLSLAILAACSGTTTVDPTSSSSGIGGLGGIGGYGTNGNGGNGSGSTTSQAIGGTTAGSSGSSSPATLSSSSGHATQSSSGSSGTTAAPAAASSGTGATVAAATVAAAASGSSGSTGSCVATGEYVGIGNAVECCTGITDASGYCSTSATTASTTGNAGTNGTGTTGTVGGGTGTTTGGTCPMNMPNLATGETSTVAGSCSPTGDPCPPGFSCINDRCTLHGAGGQLQMTMSWDDAEDLDLHVWEPQASQPNGYCEIYYGNVGNRIDPDGGLDADANTSLCTPVGWLDRDSNPACDFDNVDVENVIYPEDAGPPSGTYTVLSDFWEDCAGEDDNGTTVPAYSTINYAIQVRREGAVYQYCRSFTPSDVDGSGPCNPNGGGLYGKSCTIVDTFTFP
jgi:hypothetical protein